MKDTYKITWEQVSPMGEGARFYLGDRPCFDPTEVPDEYWHEVVNETDDYHDQFAGLQQQIIRGELIRNVRVYHAVVQEPEWVLIAADYGQGG